MTTKNWFTERDLIVLNYQQKAIADVQQSIEDRKISVLAACPSAGKTIMTINIIADYLNNNPLNKVLVLTHGRTILRSQFHDVLIEMNNIKSLGFTYDLVEKFNEYDENIQVNICLPQTLNNKILSPIDLLIVDEAHDFYDCKMIDSIIEKIQPSKQLLLTGTPSSFILKGMPIIPITLFTIYDEGMTCNPIIDIATSSYQFTKEQFNYATDELYSDVIFKQAATNKTLDDLLFKIVDKLESFKDNKLCNFTGWLPALLKMQKTMMVCRSRAQARQVQNYFEKIGIKSVLSISGSESDTDKNSKKIKYFTEHDDCLLLIVCGRGILGFNYTELINVVDLSMSQNIDRIYQLMCRIVRKSKKSPELTKMYFKVVPNTMSEYYLFRMTCVLNMMDEEFYTHYNGKNLDTLTIPTVRPVKPKVDKPLIDEPDKPVNVPSVDRPTIDKGNNFLRFDIPIMDLFKSIYHKKDALLHTFALTRISEARSRFMEKRPNGYWLNMPKEEIREIASEFDSISEFIKGNACAYCVAKDNFWLDEFFERKMKPDGYWLNMSKEEIQKIASEFDSRDKLKMGNNRIYKVILENGWMDEIFKRRKKTNGFYENMTKEEMREVASEFDSISKFLKGNHCAYNVAFENGWLDEFFERKQKPNGYYKYMTKEELREVAKGFDSINKFRIGNNGAYEIARQNKWIKEFFPKDKRAA